MVIEVFAYILHCVWVTEHLKCCFKLFWSLFGAVYAILENVVVKCLRTQPGEFHQWLNIRRSPNAPQNAAFAFAYFWYLFASESVVVTVGIGKQKWFKAKKIIISSSDNTLIASKGKNSDFIS